VFVLRLGGFLLSSDNDRCAEGGALRGVFGPVRFRHLAWLGIACIIRAWPGDCCPRRSGAHSAPQGRDARLTPSTRAIHRPGGR
jgi:hypothetical protein